MIYDHQRTLFLGVLTLNLALLLELEGLESLDFHHQIKALLLFNPLLLKALGLLELAVTDGHDLGVQHHLIHLFDIIVLFVHHLLGLGKEGVSLVLLDLLLLAEGHLGCALFVQLKHALLAGLSCCHGTVLLFLE